MKMPTHKHAVHGLLTGLLGSLLCLAGTAAAQMAEVEPNDSQNDAQMLCMGSSSMSVTASIGSGGTTSDFDIFGFNAIAGEAPTIQVTSDGTWDPLMVLYDDLGNILNQSDDVYVPAYSTDPAISNYAVPATGSYYVAVAGSPNYLNSNFTPMAPGTQVFGGAYTLDVSGVTSDCAPPVAETEPEPTVEEPPVVVEEPPVTDEGATIITMEVLHWRGQDREISKRWKKRMKKAKRRMVRRYGVYPIPVVMFSSQTFDATDVDPKSLTFGPTGDEDSLFRCSRRGRDVNKDGMKDMLCFFDAFKTEFEVGDVQGHLNGETHQGEAFTSSASLKIYKLAKNKRKGKKWKKREKRYDRWHKRNHRGWHDDHDDDDD